MYDDATALSHGPATLQAFPERENRPPFALQWALVYDGPWDVWYMRRFEQKDEENR